MDHRTSESLSEPLLVTTETEAEAVSEAVTGSAQGTDTSATTANVSSECRRRWTSSPSSILATANHHECSCSSANDSNPTRVSPPSSSPSSSSSLSSSRNVTVILWYTWFVFCGRSIWNQNVLANFAFLLRDGDPKAVGYLTAAMGISQLVASLPAGYLADKYRRDTLLKAASGLGVAAVGTSLAALKLERYDWLMGSLCVWGVYWGCAQTALTALFADSVPDGQRSFFFTRRSVLIKLGQLAGPSAALLMFLKWGDEWTIHHCSKVMAVGQLICLPAVGLLCWLHDDDHDHDLATSSGNGNGTSTSTSTSTTASNPVATIEEAPLVLNANASEDEENLRAPYALGSNGLDDDDDDDDDDDVYESFSAASQHSDDDDDDDQINAEEEAQSPGDGVGDETYDRVRLAALLPWVPKERVIPTLVAVADVTSGLASGMSIRYLAIFLVDNLHIGPVMVQVLYMIAPLVQVGLMQSIQFLAKSAGRCKMAVLFKWMGIVLMILMVVSYTQHWPVWLTCTIMIFRTAFMNAPSALTRSVLMDHVPTHERAKWSALESLNMFSWSGSAAIGGILVDTEGIVVNFCVTAGLQFLATLPLVLLSFYSLPRRQEEAFQ